MSLLLELRQSGKQCRRKSGRKVHRFGRASAGRLSKLAFVSCDEKVSESVRILTACIGVDGKASKGNESSVGGDMEALGGIGFTVTKGLQSAQW